MITVDCRDVESIKNELLVYVADQIGAIPALKIHEFVLSPIEEDDVIDKSEVITAIKEFLDSIGEARNFAVISKEEVIEGGYKTKERILHTKKSDYAMVRRGDKVIGHIEFEASRFGREKWKVKNEERR